MSELSKREQAREEFWIMIRWAAGSRITAGHDNDVGIKAVVDLIIDAAKEELREEMDSLDEEILREMHRRHGKPTAGDGEDRP